MDAMGTAAEEAVGRATVLRDLEFRYKLSEDLGKIAQSVAGGEDVKQCIEMLKRPVASSSKAAAGSRAMAGAAAGAVAEAVDMGAVKQIQEMLPDNGDGFVSDRPECGSRSCPSRERFLGELGTDAM
eukprot:523719-Rhodomonas_salina.1